MCIFKAIDRKDFKYFLSIRVKKSSDITIFFLPQIKHQTNVSLLVPYDLRNFVFVVFATNFLNDNKNK